MKKTRYLSGFLFLFTLFVVSGCTQSNVPQPQKTPEQMVKDSVKNMASVKSYQFDARVKGAIVEATAPNKLNFDFGFSGGFDLKNLESIMMNIKADVLADADEQHSTATLETRFNKDMLYFNIGKLAMKNADGSEGVPKDFTDSYVGKWWKLTLPPQIMKEFSTALASSGDDQKLTPQMKQMKELFLSTSFLQDIKYIGAEDIKGEQSYHYHGRLNKDALVGFFVKLAEIQGQPAQAEDKTMMTNELKKVDISVDFWIGKNTVFLNQVLGEMKFLGDGKVDPQGTVTFQTTLWDFNKGITVDVPKDAQNVPENLLPPGLLGLPSTTVDPSITPSISGVNSQETTKLQLKK